LSTTPMLLAVTPFPSPLTTPPVTTTYFISLSSPCEPPPSMRLWQPFRLQLTPGTRWLRAAAATEEESAAIATELARLPQLRSPNEGPISLGPNLLVFPLLRSQTRGQPVWDLACSSSPHWDLKTRDQLDSDWACLSSPIESPKRGAKKLGTKLPWLLPLRSPNEEPITLGLSLLSLPPLTFPNEGPISLGPSLLVYPHWDPQTRAQPVWHVKPKATSTPWGMDALNKVAPMNVDINP
jgi:hypothetical protein